MRLEQHDGEQRVVSPEPGSGQSGASEEDGHLCEARTEACFSVHVAFLLLLSIPPFLALESERQ